MSNQGNYQGQGQNNNQGQGNGQKTYSGPTPDIFVSTKQLTNRATGEMFAGVSFMDKVPFGNAPMALVSLKPTAAFRDFLASNGLDLAMMGDAVLFTGFKTEYFPKNQSQNQGQAHNNYAQQGAQQQAPVNQGYAQQPQQQMQQPVQQPNIQTQQGVSSNGAWPQNTQPAGYAPNQGQQPANLDNIPF